MLIHSDAGPKPGTEEPDAAAQMFWEGKSKKITMFPNLNMAFSYMVDERAEVSLFLHLHGYTYSIVQHPKGGDPSRETGSEYDIHRVIKVIKRGYVNMGVVPGFLFKYYWDNQDFWRWYSALGLGVFVQGDPVITDHLVVPQITLIGTHFGRGHWYGVADFSLGPMGLGPQVGCGYRF